MVLTVFRYSRLRIKCLFREQNWFKELFASMKWSPGVSTTVPLLGGQRYFISLRWEEVEGYKKLLGGKLGCVGARGRGWLPPMRDDQRPSPTRSQLFPIPTALCSFCFWPNLLFSRGRFSKLGKRPSISVMLHSRTSETSAPNSHVQTAY